MLIHNITDSTKSINPVGTTLSAIATNRLNFLTVVYKRVLPYYK